MGNYNEDVFLSEPFVLGWGEDSTADRYIPPRFLNNRKSFNRIDGRMESYKDDHGLYRIPKKCAQTGITIRGERSTNPAGQRCTIYRFAPGMNPKEKDFKLFASLRK